MNGVKNRFARFFFMHLGLLVPLLVYFGVLGPDPSPERVRRALGVGLGVAMGYAAAARACGELKQFDVALVVMFAAGTLLVGFDVRPAVLLFQRFSGAVLFTTLGIAAVLPLVLGREAFTYHYARRQAPRWQHRLPEFHAINRVVALWWVVIFFTGAGLAAAAPRDARFAVLYPNLLVLVGGLPASLWLPRLYLWLHPPASPTAVEAVIMGMPMVFERRAAGAARATLQFCVTGSDAAEYHVRIERGRCRSFEGRAPGADLTIHTPADVWMRIARGDLDGGQALADGLYRAEGDLAVLASLPQWFPPRARAAPAPR